LASGTARKLDSVAVSAEESRNPKMAEVGPEEEALPLAIGDGPERNRAEERMEARRNFIGLPKSKIVR